jgi:general secretion pathway protein D
MAAAGAAHAAREAEPANISVRYLNAPLTQILTDIAKATRETFVSDPSLPGRFTITIPRKVTKSEALAVLEAALVMQGYATLTGPNGEYQVLKVTVASSGAPWKGTASDAIRPNLITTLIPLEVARVEDVLSKISHLIGKADAVVAYPPTNSLILSGSERRIVRIIELAQALDASGERDVWIRTLRHRGVVEASELLAEVMQQPAALVVNAIRAEAMQILADQRLNSVIVIGTDSEIDRARSFLADIDRPVEIGTRINVVRIFHRDVEDIGTLLVEMAVGRNLAVDQLNLTETLLGKQYVVVADPGTNSLVIDADTDTYATLLEVIAKLDRPQPRIQVDVIAYEIANPTQLDLGIDFFMPAITPDDVNNTALTVSSNPSGGGLRNQIGSDITFFGRASRDPLLLPFTDANGNVVDVVVPRETVVVTANARTVQTRVLLQPRLLMTSGEEQKIFVGQSVPILTGTAQETAVNQTRSSVERQDVGAELRITPTLGEVGGLQLKVRLEISRIAPSVAGSVDEVGPTIEKREIESNIRLEDGGLAVIGMSQEGPRSEATAGVPFLSDIPILGYLTDARSSSGNDVHLVFAVQARILRSPEEDLAESIRQRLAVERSLAKMAGLSRTRGKPYGVLVTTRGTEADAKVLAEGLEREGGEAQIGRWERRGREYFDVYLTGYSSLDRAGADAIDLRARGFAPQVVVLPGETAVATAPPLRLLGSRLSDLNDGDEIREDEAESATP